MVREADLIRSEIDQTRTDLDQQAVAARGARAGNDAAPLCAEVRARTAFERVVGSALMFAGAADGVAERYRRT